MNRRVYDLALLIGLLLVTAGAGLAFGWAAALATAGALLILLTIHSASLPY